MATKTATKAAIELDDMAQIEDLDNKMIKLQNQISHIKRERDALVTSMGEEADMNSQQRAARMARIAKADPEYPVLLKELRRVCKPKNVTLSVTLKLKFDFNPLGYGEPINCRLYGDSNDVEAFNSDYLIEESKDRFGLYSLIDNSPVVKAKAKEFEEPLNAWFKKSEAWVEGIIKKNTKLKLDKSHMRDMRIDVMEEIFFDAELHPNIEY